jgi:Lhr-like helicase
MRVIPENCLDMAAQAILNICFTEKLNRKEILDFIRSASVYKNFPESSLDLILDYLLALDEKSKLDHIFARLNRKWIFFSIGGTKKIEFLVNTQIYSY